MLNATFHQEVARQDLSFVIGKKAVTVPLRLDEDLKIRGSRIKRRKQLPGLSTLFRQYIQEGIERDEKLMGLAPYPASTHETALLNEQRKERKPKQ